MKKDYRRPVSFLLLQWLLAVSVSICSDSCETLLFCSAFSLALQIGELVAPNARLQSNLKASDVVVLNCSIKVRISRLKSDPCGPGTWLSILSIEHSCWQVRLFAEFVSARAVAESFLLHANNHLSIQVYIQQRSCSFRTGSKNWVDVNLSAL